MSRGPISPVLIDVGTVRVHGSPVETRIIPILESRVDKRTIPIPKSRVYTGTVHTHLSTPTEVQTS